MYQHLFSRTPVKLRMNGQTRRYDSFVISVVEKMAKHLKLSDDTERPDGQFAIHAQPHRSLLSLLSYLIRLSLNRQDESRFSSSLTMELLHKATLQVDGETYELPAGSKLSIECQRNKLQTII